MEKRDKERRSILTKLDRLHGTLGHTGPTFDTVLGMNRLRLINLNSIDLAGADFDTVSAALASLSVHNGIHNKLKLQMPNYKFQINSKLQMT